VPETGLSTTHPAQFWSVKAIRCNGSDPGQICKGRVGTAWVKARGYRSWCGVWVLSVYQLSYAKQHGARWCVLCTTAGSAGSAGSQTVAARGTATQGFGCCCRCFCSCHVVAAGAAHLDSLKHVISSTPSQDCLEPFWPPFASATPDLAHAAPLRGSLRQLQAGSNVWTHSVLPLHLPRLTLQVPCLTTPSDVYQPQRV
jgi:hypothetical protein